MLGNIVFTEKKNFLSEIECSKLIEFYNLNINETFSYRDTFPLNTSPNLRGFDITRLYPIVDEILHECKTYDENILLDTCQIVKWPIGSFMKPHTDPPGDVFAAIVYLNDDYVGGETCFNDMIIIPETGKLVIFSNNHLLHWVNTIKNTNRYTLALWFTRNDFC